MKYDENEERKKRIKEIALGGAGIAIGTYALKQTGRFEGINKFFKDFRKTASNIAEDLGSKPFRDWDYSTLNKIAKKNFFDEDSVWKSTRRDTGIELDYSRGLLSSLLEYKKLDSDQAYVKDELFNSYQKNEIFKSLDKSIKDKNSEYMEELYKLVSKAVDKKSIFFEYDEDFETKAIRDRFDEVMKGTLLEKDKDTITDVIEEAINISQDKRDEFLNDYDKTIKPQLVESFKNELKEKYNPENHKDKFFKETLDRAATINDLLRANEEGSIHVNNDKLAEFGENENVFNFLQNIVNADSDFGNLVIDNATLRVNKNNEVYSTKELHDFIYNIKESYSDTLMGKLFFGRSFTDIDKAPDFYYIAKGSYDPIIAKLDEADNNIVRNDFFKLGNKFYKLDEQKNLEHFEKADDLYLMSGRHGTLKTLYDKMQGNTIDKVPTNKLFKDLDINTAGHNMMDRARGFINKFDDDSNWKRKIIDRLLNPDNYKNNTVYSNFQFLKDVDAINKMYNERTFAPKNTTLKALKDVTGKKAQILLEAAESDNIAEYLIRNYNKDYINPDLKSLVNKAENHISSLRDTAQIGSLGGKSGINVLRYNDLLKREILKEVMLIDSRDSTNNIKGFSATLSKLEKMNLPGAEKKNARNLYEWAILQNITHSFSSTSHYIRTREQNLTVKNQLGAVLNAKHPNEQINYFLQSFRNNMKEFINENTSIKDIVYDETSFVKQGYKNNRWMTMRKGVSPLDIINSLNDDIKYKANINKFTKQFYAGRNNTNDITTYSFIPYHFINRLIAPLESVGLGFSSANTGSVKDLTKNAILKRILPAVALVYGASYLNFEAQNITGRSFTQDYFSFRASIGLGVKTIQQGLGLSDKLRSSRMYNPLTNYYFGEYKDKEEYEDYLNNGYDPIRKGRWWNFGSGSEFKGGKISYWAPNNLRQAYSNYKDIAIYGSSDEKWKHSIIPTPRHPLSTLRYLADPYWLEKKHYWDRPYPVTGDLFSSETPWGAILNPTVGQLIKPRRRMHQAELQGTMLDVRTIIEERNKKIREKANNNELAIVDKSGFTPLKYSPTSMPSSNEAVFSLHFSHGKLVSAGYDGRRYAETKDMLTNPKMPVIDDYNSNYSMSTSSGISTINNGEFKSVYYQLEKDSRLQNIANTIISNITDIFTGHKKYSQGTLDIIGQLNSNIKDEARQRTINSNEYSRDGVFIEQARLYRNPYTKAEENAKDKYLDKLNIQNINSKKEYVSNLMYSGKELAGMYGFLFESIFPNSHGYKLAQAGHINSFIRGFWDSSLGGNGGDVMEIARRFFPHANHDIEEINPIKNTMPSWLPSRFQFGDPYTMLPMGEARLPGKGYEALNRLHPDQYGRYGAFDRYKILADVSPGSDEYKIWKKIAQEEISNNAILMKQMSQIEKRVSLQSKDHNFYDYLFLGQHLDSKKAVIETVSSNGQFTITGSNEKYQLAGVKPKKNPETKQSYIYDYLKPGMIVTLEYDRNKYDRINSNGNISAIVKTSDSNISKEMFEDKKASENNTQDTLADKRFAAGDLINVTGPIFELIGHAQIPYIHNKYMNINSPIESYKKEQIYGTNYSTWAHPIKGYIKPTFQSSFARNPLLQAAGIGAWALSEKATREGWKTFGKGGVAHALFAFTNPGALAGGIIGAIPKMNFANHSSKIWNTQNGARIGAAAGIIGYGLANLNNPILSIVNFGVAGAAVADQLKMIGKDGEKILGRKGALIGAGVGLALSALKNPSFKSISTTYVPKDTKKKWEIEEYYDRLEYIKYTNLYRKASRKAKFREGIDVYKIVNKFNYVKDKNNKETESLLKKKDLINNSMLSRDSKQKLIAAIDYKINSLSVPEQYFRLGKYSKEALAYKKAADTTIYGLTNNSTTADVLRALPKYDRDYFIEFSKEKDPKKQKKILNMVSPYKRKALEVMWGKKTEKQKTNEEFFSTHKLPNMFWSGWNPQENLDNVKMKTIENEGMLLSDFGFYDSQTKTPAAKNSPEIKNIHNTLSPLSLRANMLSLLNGIGLSSVDVSVEATASAGLQIITNIERVSKYTVQQKISNILNSVF